jgi:hypothetical protein
VPQEVWQEIKTPLGLHHGYWLEGGKDVKLREVFERDKTPEAKLKHLSEWSSFSDRESSLLTPGHTTIWHPNIKAEDHDLIRQWAGKRLIEIEASTTEEALHKFRLSPWQLGVFYHCACMGNWKEVIEEQLALAARVGLTTMYVGLLGSDDDLAHFEARAKALGVTVDVVYHHTDLLMFEIPTIRLVADFAASHPDNYVLYWHTKGVSSPKDTVKVRWRRLMDMEVIGQWKRNTEYLRGGLDTVGVNWRHHPPTSHWAGNYWMSKSSYLNSLEDFSHYYRHPRHWSGDHINQFRLGAEMWHGAGVPEPKIKSLVTFNERIDFPGYWHCSRGLTVGFILTVYKEPASMVDWCLSNIRAAYPAAPITVITDGVDAQEYRQVSERHHATYQPGERLKLVEHGAKWWKRLLEMGLAMGVDFIFKIDADTKIHREFRSFPQGDIFGTKQLPYNIQGGLHGFTKAAAVKIIDSGLCDSEKYTNPDWCVASKSYFLKCGQMTTDHTMSDIAMTLDLKVVNWAEVDSHWEAKVFREDVAATHPHKSQSDLKGHLVEVSDLNTTKAIHLEGCPS